MGAPVACALNQGATGVNFQKLAAFQTTPDQTELGYVGERNRINTEAMRLP
jgi:hypothetical protein